MKKKQFNVFLQEEINKIRLTIEKLNALKTKLRSETELQTKDHDSKKELLEEYYKYHKKGFLASIKPVSDTKLIDFIVKIKTKEYEVAIQEMLNIINELALAEKSFKDDKFTTLFAPSDITIRYLIKYGYKEEIEPHQILRQIILLSKLSLITEDKKNQAMPQYIKALSKLFKNDLTYHQNDKKTVEFILRKLSSSIYFNITEQEPEQYLKRVASSLEKHLSTLTPEDKKEYIALIKKNHSPEQEIQLVAKYQLNELIKETSDNQESKYNEAIELLNQDQLLIIHTAFEIIKKEKNKNIILMLQKAINDIISISRYLELGNGVFDTTENEELLNERVDFLSFMVRMLKKKEKGEPLYDFLADSSTGYPFIIEDSRAMDETAYPAVFEAIANIDKLEKEMVFKKGKTTIYQGQLNEITLLFAVRGTHIIIITAANKLTEKVLTRDYYPLIIEQIKKKYDKKAQTIYCAIVEREIDLSYFLKEDRSFIKKRKENN